MVLLSTVSLSFGWVPDGKLAGFFPTGLLAHLAPGKKGSVWNDGARLSAGCTKKRSAEANQTSSSML